MSRRIWPRAAPSAMISARCACTVRRLETLVVGGAPESCKWIGRPAFAMLTCRSIRPALLFLAAGALAACTAIQPPATPAAAAAHAQLDRVRTLFADGKYGDVIRTVATSDQLAAAPAGVQVEALKLQAFSYCVSGYRRLCEDGFIRILLIQPSFDLPAAERGHPQWGPAFRSAKTALTPARPNSRAADSKP